MTPSDIVSIILGAASIVISITLGGFAIWQARDFARDARLSASETARLQADMAGSVRTLEGQSNLLSSILGAQIDRLTAHVTQNAATPQQLIDAFRSFQVQAPPAALPPASGESHSDAQLIELIQTQVAATRLAGAFNIFLRHVVKELEQLRPESQSTQVDNMFDVLFADSYKEFSIFLDRLQKHTPDQLERAQATDMLEAFRANYVPHVKPTVSST